MKSKQTSNTCIQMKKIKGHKLNFHCFTIKNFFDLKKKKKKKSIYEITTNQMNLFKEIKGKIYMN